LGAQGDFEPMYSLRSPPRARCVTSTKPLDLRLSRIAAAGTQWAIDNGPSLEISPQETVRQLNGEIAMLREDLARLVAELDRRRHEALDVKLQVKRHALGVVLTGAAVLAAPLGLGLATRRARPHRGLLAKARQVRDGLSRIVEEPERMAAQPTVLTTILTAAANAAGAIVIKKMLERSLERALNRSVSRRPFLVGTRDQRSDVA